MDQHDRICAMCLCRKATEKGFEAYGDAVKERPREFPAPRISLLRIDLVGSILTKGIMHPACNCQAIFYWT